MGCICWGNKTVRKYVAKSESDVRMSHVKDGVKIDDPTTVVGTVVDVDVDVVVVVFVSSAPFVPFRNGQGMFRSGEVQFRKDKFR